MPSKDPYLVLGVEPDASPEEIKTAWRTLARRHHPDLIGDDPEVARRATRRMAEINAAYASLTRAGRTIEGHRRRATDGEPEPAPKPAPKRSGGPPPAPVTRPVTGRVDTSQTFQARNQTTTPPGVRLPLTGRPPQQINHSRRELRASQPSSPAERGWIRGHVHRVPPSLGEALEIEVGFGKFHGHTLGQIADFEPSYIDWVASTVTRDPDLAAAARVIAEELDRRGVHRPNRPPRQGWQANPFR